MAAQVKITALVCLINISKGKTCDENREGSEHDVNRLVELFRDHLGCNFFHWIRPKKTSVKKKSIFRRFSLSSSEKPKKKNEHKYDEPFCYWDLPKEHILDLISDFAADSRKCPRFLYIMGHGGMNFFIDVNGVNCTESSVLRAFSTDNAPNLKEELKYVVFNCCRTISNAAHEDDVSKKSVNSIYHNLFVAHSTVEGLASLRWPKSGSPYIEGHCNAMRLPWEENTLFDIFNKTASERLTCGRNDIANVSPDFVAVGICSEFIQKYPMSIVCMDAEDRITKITELEKPRKPQNKNQNIILEYQNILKDLCPFVNIEEEFSDDLQWLEEFKQQAKSKSGKSSTFSTLKNGKKRKHSRPSISEILNITCDIVTSTSL